MAEVPAVASVWTRVKTATKKVALTVAKPFKAVAKLARRAVTRVTSAARAAVAARPRVLRAYLAVRLFGVRLWTRSVQPLLEAMMYVTAVAAVAVSLALAPVVTLAVALGTGATLLVAARGMRALEEREHGAPWARRVLNAVDVAWRVAEVIAYVAAAGLTVATCTVSMPFALFVAGDVVLSYLQVPGATTVAFIAACLVTGQWAAAFVWLTWRMVRGGVINERAVEVPEYSEIRREPVEHVDVLRREDVVDAVEVRPSDAPNAPETWTRGEHLVAKGTEEMWGTSHDVPFVVHDDADEGRSVPVMIKCDACGTGYVNLVLSRARRGDGNDSAYVCEECYAAEAEDEAIRHTGVSLKARSIEVRLNQAGIEASEAYALSRAAAAGTLTAEQGERLAKSGWQPGDNAGVWLPVAWWRDRRGREYTREWVCLNDGVEVARVSHERKRNVYVAIVLGEVANKTWPTDGAARRAANKVLCDYEASVSKKVAELGEIAGAQPAARAG